MGQCKYCGEDAGFQALPRNAILSLQRHTLKERKRECHEALLDRDMTPEELYNAISNEIAYIYDKG